MKDKTVLLIGAGAVAAYYLFNKVGAAVGVATNAISSATAATIEALTFGPPILVTGSVANQAGQVIGPIANFPASHDAAGNTYLKINGYVYQLGPRLTPGGPFTAIPTAGAPPA